MKKVHVIASIQYGYDPHSREFAYLDKAGNWTGDPNQAHHCCCEEEAVETLKHVPSLHPDLGIPECYTIIPFYIKSK